MPSPSESLEEKGGCVVSLVDDDWHQDFSTVDLHGKKTFEEEGKITRKKVKKGYDWLSFLPLASDVGSR